MDSPSRRERLVAHLRRHAIVHAGPLCLVHVFSICSQPELVRVSIREQVDVELPFEDGVDRLLALEARGVLAFDLEGQRS